jgi:CTP synthase (UTP-ammonia lyase)
MNATIRIALIGDYNPEVTAHVAIPRALKLTANGSARAFEPTWMATPLFTTKSEELLSPFDAIWCVPNSPYASMAGALCAIRFARESGRPFLGTCGGFQHAVIEYARNALGFHEADHAESNPAATLPLISRLACSLARGKGAIRLMPNSQLASIYGRTEIAENYHCNFGLNPRFESMLNDGKLSISGRDENGEVRAVELAGHPFFIATLFQPEQSAFAGVEHPLISSFVRAAAHLK